MNKFPLLIFLLVAWNQCYVQVKSIDKKSEKTIKKCIKNAIKAEDYYAFRNILLNHQDIMKLSISENEKNLLLNKFNNSYLKERAVFNDGLKIMKDESFVLNRIKIKEFRFKMGSDLNAQIYCRLETKDKKQFVVSVENVYKIENTFKFDGLIVFSRMTSL